MGGGHSHLEVRPQEALGVTELGAGILKKSLRDWNFASNVLFLKGICMRFLRCKK
jgi:hypothetical protein